LGNSATSTSVKATTITQTKSSAVRKQNNTSRLEAINAQIVLLDSDIKVTESFMEDIGTDFIKPTTERRQFLANANYRNDEMFNWFVKFDDEAISYYVTVYNDAVSTLGHLKELGASAEQEKEKIVKSFYDNNSLTQLEKDTISNRMDDEGKNRLHILNLSKEISAYDTKHYSEYMQSLEIVKNYLAQNAPSQTTFRPTVNYYQPIVYPQIQIPQTTYCTMSGGIGGNYSIICN
jgi:hypothetical protein